MAISYIHTETGEAVSKEPWHWVALYSDGTELHQFELSRDNGAVFHRFSEIDQSRVVEFQMRHATQSPVTIILPTGAKLKHFYRNLRQVPGDEDWVRYYFVGYILDSHFSGVAITDRNEVLVTHDPDLVMRRSVNGDSL